MDFKDTELFSAKREPQDTTLLLTSGETATRFLQFHRIISGKYRYSDLPEFVKQPQSLTDYLLRLRNYAQANDQEQRGGIYVSCENNALFILDRVVVGHFNPIDFVYESGPLAAIEGMYPITSIHSHPRHDQFIKKGATETQLRPSNLPSLDDLAQEATLGKFNPTSNTTRSSIVIGKSLAVLLCHTTDTPSRESLDQTHGGWAVSAIGNFLNEIEKEIAQGRPDLKDFEKRFLTIWKGCQNLKLGMYLIALKDIIETASIWVRFNPTPGNFEKAMLTLAPF
jgi:hypothetical protein